MTNKIEQDNSRFRQIVRGQIKQDLKKYITHGEMIGRKGKDLVSIPVPQIDIPHFRYGERKAGGVGQGEGEVGMPLGPASGGKGPGAGDQPGEHILEVEVTLDELAKILGRNWSFPGSSPKARVTWLSKKTSIRASVRRVLNPPAF